MGDHKREDKTCQECRKPYNGRTTTRFCSMRCATTYNARHRLKKIPRRTKIAGTIFSPIGEETHKFLGGEDD